MKKLTTMRDDELMREAKELARPLEFGSPDCKTGKLPGGRIFRRRDAPHRQMPRLSGRLGAEAVCVGSGIFKIERSGDACEGRRKATNALRDGSKDLFLEATRELGEAMKGLDIRQMEEKDMLSDARLVACYMEWESEQSGIFGGSGNFEAHARC